MGSLRSRSTMPVGNFLEWPFIYANTPPYLHPWRLQPQNKHVSMRFYGTDTCQLTWPRWEEGTGDSDRKEFGRSFKYPHSAIIRMSPPMVSGASSPLCMGFLLKSIFKSEVKIMLHNASWTKSLTSLEIACFRWACLWRITPNHLKTFRHGLCWFR